MKILVFIAVSVVSLNLHASEVVPDARPSSRYLEISINDLPKGSEKDLDSAVREYSRTLRNGGSDFPKINQSAQGRSAVAAMVSKPADHVYASGNAKLNYLPKASLAKNGYGSLMIQPLELESTKSCTLLGTEANGVYSQKRKQHSGFSQYFQCSDGDVYLRDMTFFGMRKVVIKEQNNVVINGFSGQMAGYRDPAGNSFTTLEWVSNDIDHLVKKSGVDEPTRHWLVSYAEEVIAREAK